VCCGQPLRGYWRSMNNREEEAPELVKVSPEELALLLAYRSCCVEHRQGLRWFANASKSNCSQHSPTLAVLQVKKVSV
jgi:hypothetical protein